MMNTPGIPTTRYFDAVLLPKDQVQQKDNVKVITHPPCAGLGWLIRSWHAAGRA